MRLPARRIAASALSAGLLLGISAPVAMAADDPARESATSQAPLANADALRDQAKDLGLIGAVVAPVADLLDAVVGADSGRLSEAQANKYADAVREAIARVDARDTAGTPEAAARPPAATPDGAAPGGTAPATLPARVGADAAPGADLTAQAVSGLQKQVDALIKASTAGNAEQVRPAADNVVTSTVNVVAASLVAGRLPAPDMAGLSSVPQRPDQNAAQRDEARQDQARQDAARRD
ncbi:hypothetical protein [Streptomyces sp. CRN 30]|uniref:hypothetical protein n=1 Tax=Streptomyces sp. CRN 30 TaxID=3075613 RepID=UPI002A82A603|nr:hypothetical protein [Streptomyces sp. CRN 30]